MISMDLSTHHCHGFRLRGLTFPGIIEDPGSFSGKDNSPKPDRGPEPKKRMSLAILKRETAIVLMAPWVWT